MESGFSSQSDDFSQSATQKLYPSIEKNIKSSIDVSSLLLQIQQLHNELASFKEKVIFLKKKIEVLTASLSSTKSRTCEQINEYILSLKKKDEEVKLLSARLDQIKAEKLVISNQKNQDEFKEKQKQIDLEYKQLKADREQQEGLLAAREEEFSLKAKELDLRLKELADQEEQIRIKKEELVLIKEDIKKETFNLETLQEEILASSQALQEQKELIENSHLVKNQYNLCRAVAIELRSEQSECVKHLLTINSLKKQLEAALGVQKSLQEQIDISQKTCELETKIPMETRRALASKTISEDVKPVKRTRRKIDDGLSQKRKASPVPKSLKKTETRSARRLQPSQKK